MDTPMVVPSVLHKKAEHRKARHHNHTETCRAKIYEALRIVGSEKITLAESDDKERTRTRVRGEPATVVPDDPPGLVDDLDDEVLETSDVELEDAVHDDAMDAPELEGKTADMAPSDDFFREVDEAQSTWDTPMDNDGYDHMVTMLTDGFQCNGVEPEVACIVASQLARILELPRCMAEAPSSTRLAMSTKVLTLRAAMHWT